MAIADLFFGKFLKDLNEIEKTLVTRLKVISTWSYLDITPHDKFAEGDCSVGAPQVALRTLYEDRKTRTVLGLDKAAEPLTHNDPMGDKGLSVTDKMKAALSNNPIPTGARVAVLGISEGYDMKLYPPGTHFYDLEAKVIQGIKVDALDVNNAAALSDVMQKYDVIISDVCPALDNANIDMTKLHAQCGYGRYLTIFTNLCKAAMNARQLKMFVMKAFLAPNDIGFVPPPLVPLLRRWGCFILKPGKLHSDEYYLVFSESAPKRTMGYFNISMLRISHAILLGHEVATKGLAIGSLGWYRLPEATNAWNTLHGSELPYGMPKGTGYKDYTPTDFQTHLATLFSNEGFEPAGDSPDQTASLVLVSQEAKDESVASLIDRRPAGARNVPAAQAALDAAVARAGLASAWAEDPVPALKPPAAAPPSDEEPSASSLGEADEAPA